MKELFSKINKNKEMLLFTIATVVSAMGHFIFSIVSKIYIVPNDYGVYSTCLLLTTYLGYLQLGVMNSYNRDYPQLIGANEDEKAKKLSNVSFSFISAVYLLASVALTILFAILDISGMIEKRYTVGFALCAINSLLIAVENFGSAKTRITKGFNIVSYVIMLQLISVVIGIVLTIKIGYYALYLTTMCSYLIGILLYYKPAFRDIQLDLDKQLLVQQIKFGLPLLISGLIWTIVNSIDKFVILTFVPGSATALGLYSIAQMGFSYMILIPTALSQVFYVKMGKIYGDTKDVQVLNRVALNYTRVVSIITCIVAFIALFLLSDFVNLIIPNYNGGVKSAQILIVGLSFYAPTMVNGNILTILKENAAILRSSIYLCLLNIIFSISLVLLFGAKIEYVALGTAISYVIRSLIVVVQIRIYAKADAWLLILNSIIPVLITIIPSLVVYYLIQNKIIGLAMVLVLLGVIGGLYLVNRRKRVE